MSIELYADWHTFSSIHLFVFGTTSLKSISRFIISFLFEQLLFVNSITTVKSISLNSTES